MTPQDWTNIDLFLNSLKRELSHLPNDFTPDTVFVGGGTPTALSSSQLAKVLDCVNETIDLSKVVEFSSEANPGTLSLEKLVIMRERGINRVSIGVQSFNDKALRLLGRIHQKREAIDAYYLLREAGFNNVNIDLIQSIPGMSQQERLADVQKVIELNPEHISFYNLSYEDDTPMTHARDEGRIVPPNDDEEADTYFTIKSMLEDSGYVHYEISNFCRTERECQHKLLYWQSGEYFGCGPSAHSHWNGARFGNVSDLYEYCNCLSKDEKPFNEVERLAKKQKAREVLVLGLRLIDGIVINEFERVAGFALEDLCGSSIEMLIKEGLLISSEGRLQLAPDALFISNTVFSELI